MIENVRRILSTTHRRIMLATGFGRVAVTRETAGRQEVQVALLRDETRWIRRLAEYGFASRPKRGADVVAVFQGGNRDGGLVIATDDARYRIALEDGEVALYDDRGNVVHLGANGIRLTSPLRVTVDAPELACRELVASGSVRAAGEVADRLGTMQAMRQLYDVHTHEETGTVTGPPVPPMGVAP